ncbi:DUF4362 domain-containing protein [Paenibacillus sp. IHBB 3054]|uniref:DUF4362 domain-containing protein n=1 Tax=Paenibacillus sp. IHBB 3054 TaxID=3425689 RepID=UPI003F6700F1
MNPVRFLKWLLLTAFLALLIFAGFSLLHWKENTANRPKISHELNEQEDVVLNHGFTIRNLYRLDDFIERQSGRQRVVQYTMEGDPIFKDLQFKKGKLWITDDTTQDEYGPHEILTYACSTLERSETDTALKYTLIGCEGEAAQRVVLQVDFDLQQEDRFEFVLKYGVNRRNEINIRDGKLNLDLQNGSVLEVLDFLLSQQDQQRIYREMVLANYLRDKEVSEECNMKPYVSYELETTINAREQHYIWSECDNSRDGTEMTALAKFIIEIVESGERYKGLPKAKGGYE